MDDVCFNWYYPFHIAPLWEWLADLKTIPTFIGTTKLHAWDISPTEQLSLVLPMESWSLMPVCPERDLPYKAPHLFPAEFSFDSIGKRFFWECESLIPLPSILEVKSWISS
jgi:5'-3' exonuclease